MEYARTVSKCSKEFVSLKGQCVGIEAMQSRMISQPVKSLM